MNTKKAYFTVTIAIAAVLTACGRPSTSKYFELDGVGDPDAPISGNPIPGRWGGNIELTNFNTLYPSYSIFTPPLPFQLSEAYFNETEISGLGGWGLFGITMVSPPRIPEGKRSACYMNPASLPLLGGDLVSTDIGEDLRLDFNDDDVPGLNLSRDSDEDIAAGDLLIWSTPFTENGLTTIIPGDAEIDFRWDGGTKSGYKKAPPLDERPLIRFPQALAISDTGGLPTINGVTLSTAMVATDTEYEIQWERETGAEEDLVGVEIILTVYGPANFGDASEPQMSDTPFTFDKQLARIVCLVDDDEESFTIYQSDIDPSPNGEYSPFTLDDAIEMAIDSGKYEFSTEDANGNGVLDPEFNCGPPTQPTTCIEDGNGNGTIDKIYGIALTINRRTERVHELDIGGNGQSNVFVSGNNSIWVKMEYGAP